MTPRPAAARPGARWTRRDLLRLGGLSTFGLALPGLAGCGSGSGSDADVNLEFMFWGSAFEQEAIERMLEQFSERNESVSVKPIYTPDEYDTKINTLVASNQTPDVAYLPPGQAYRLAEQGKLVNLFPYFDTYPQLAQRLPTTYYWWDEDKTFGTQTANEVMLVWYNRAAFQDAGVDPVPAVAAEAWSWDDLIEAADRLTFDAEGRHPSEPGFDADDVKQFGISTDFTYDGVWYSFLRSAGGDFADEAGTTFTMDSPEAIEVFQNFQDAIYTHRVAPTPAQMGGDNAPSSTVQLQTRRVAMVIDGHWALLDMSQQDGLDYGIGVLPSLGEPASAQIAGASAVFASTDHEQEAVEFYVFHNDPEHVDLYADGLWMPLELKYYTEPEFIESWTSTDIHPPEFRTAVVDYALEHGVTRLSNRLKNMDAITNDVLLPALQQIQTGSRPARDVLTELKADVEPLLQGWYPTQEL